MKDDRPQRDLRITRLSEGFFRDKGDGTSVRYYVFPEYEIHYNEVLPGTVQEWHHHDVIDEVIYVSRGQIEVRWRDEHGSHVDIAGEGDIVSVGSAPHTLVNSSDEVTTFLVFRMVADGVDKRQAIQSDKVLDNPSK